MTRCRDMIALLLNQYYWLFIYLLLYFLICWRCFYVCFYGGLLQHNFVQCCSWSVFGMTVKIILNLDWLVVFDFLEGDLIDTVKTAAEGVKTQSSIVATWMKNNVPPTLRNMVPVTPRPPAGEPQPSTSGAADWDERPVRSYRLLPVYFPYSVTQPLLCYSLVNLSTNHHNKSVTVVSTVYNLKHLNFIETCLSFICFWSLKTAILWIRNLQLPPPISCGKQQNQVRPLKKDFASR